LIQYKFAVFLSFSSLKGFSLTILNVSELLYNTIINQKF